MDQRIIVNKHHKSLEQILPELKGHKLIVSGAHFEKKDLFNAMDDISEVEIPPGLITPEMIQHCLEKIAGSPDVIIAIGGGRILDAAKLMINEKRFKRPLFLAIPTTAGSGSEATPFAVMYQNGIKQSLEAAFLLPDQVVLDPWFLDGLPPFQKADSAFDTFCQAIESLWNVRSTGFSRIYASQALEISLKNIIAYVRNEGEARFPMLWAAHLSGKAIAITRTTGCHAVSYYLTARHGISHGQAVAIFLPVFFIYNKDADLSKLLSLLKVSNEEEAAEKIRKMMKECGLSTSFRELNITVDIEALLASVNAERFSNNPVPFQKEKLKNLILQYLF